MDSRLQGAAYLHSPEKLALDKFGARLLLVSWPGLLAVRSIIKIRHGGPTLVSLPRVGKDGAIFHQHKLRTMECGSEQSNLPLFDKQPDDSRINSTGKILRRYSIDELPQAKNILAGEMSLIGSRPKSTQEVAALSDLDPDFYTAYTLMHPGLTGLEQVNGRGTATPLARIEFTKQYADEASLALDMDILKKTIGAIASRDGAY